MREKSKQGCSDEIQRIRRELQIMSSKLDEIDMYMDQIVNQEVLDDVDYALLCRHESLLEMYLENIDSLTRQLDALTTRFIMKKITLSYFAR